MARTSPLLVPDLSGLLGEVGNNLKLARLRRHYSAEVMAQRAGISRKTLYRAERGDPAVALGIYARVLQVLQLERDLVSLAGNDVLGRQLQDAALVLKQRAPRRKPAPSSEDDEGSA